MTFTATDRAKLAAVFTLLGQIKDGQDAQTVILRGIEADHASTAETLAALQQGVDAILALLQPQEPPPPTLRVQLGVERGVQGMSLDQALADLQQRIGVMIPLHHTYDLSGVIPTSFAATVAGPDVARGVRSMLGIHYDPADAIRGDLDDRARSLVASGPDDAIYIVWHEWDAHGQDPAVIAQSQNHLHDVMKAIKPTIQVWACTTGYFFDPGNHSGLRDRYAAALDPDRIDGVSIDAYQRYLFPPAADKSTGAPHTGWDPAPTPQMALALDWCNQLGVQLAIAETCCASDDVHPVADKLTWWNDLVAWAEANDLAFITYFDTELNQDVGPGSMIEDQAEFAAVWADDVRARS